MNVFISMLTPSALANDAMCAEKLRVPDRRSILASSHSIIHNLHYVAKHIHYH